ncbi:Fe(3+) ions import ATP-binding protein FbpC [Cronobacter sakazakii]|nr:Fe(3+) ions import ATP-binding protein FbpC [Cronobacter sakazakii]
MKASSRQNPFIRFEQDKKLFRNALEVEAMTKGFDNGPLFKNVGLLLEVGEKLAILGANGVGKSTMLKTLGGRTATGQRHREMVRERADWLLRAGSRV